MKEAIKRELRQLIETSQTEAIAEILSYMAEVCEEKRVMSAGTEEYNLWSELQSTLEAIIGILQSS